MPEGERTFRLQGSRSRRHGQTIETKSVGGRSDQDIMVGKRLGRNGVHVRPCSGIRRAGILQRIDPVGVGVEVNGDAVGVVAFDEVDVRFGRPHRLGEEGQREYAGERTFEKPWICLADCLEHRSDIGWHERNLTVKRTGATVCSGKVISRLLGLSSSGTAERCSPVFSFVYFTLCGQWVLSGAPGIYGLPRDARLCLFWRAPR